MNYQLFMMIVLGYFPMYHSFTTPLRKIVTIQAISSSLSNVINREFISDDSLLNDLVTYHRHIEADIIYSSILTFSLFVEYQYYYKKWNNVEFYKQQHRYITIILTFLFIMLTRNVQIAS